jgi:DNA modification methylase
MSATNRGATRHKDEALRLFNGDCADLLRSLESDSVDAIITDPPYGTASETKVQKRGNNDLEVFNLEWDGELPTAWLTEACRACVPGGALLTFTNNREVTTLWNAMESAGWKPLQTFTWIKSNPPPQPRQNFCSGIETAIFARKPGKVYCWNGGGATVNYFQAPIVAGTRIHPTQKPESLMAHLIRLLSPVGGVVLDPFMGSGTTGVCAIANGRRFIGAELDASYFQAAKARIDAAANQEVLIPVQNVAPIQCDFMDATPTVRVIDSEVCK